MVTQQGKRALRLPFTNANFIDHLTPLRVAAAAFRTTKPGGRGHSRDIQAASSSCLAGPLSASLLSPPQSMPNGPFGRKPACVRLRGQGACLNPKSRVQSHDERTGWALAPGTALLEQRPEHPLYSPEIVQAGAHVSQLGRRQVSGLRAVRAIFQA